MIERSRRVPSLSLGPDALKRAADAFDESWTAIAANFNDAEAENARTQLATIILGLARMGVASGAIESGGIGVRQPWT